ncbi:MAG: hypothetical protein LAT68_05955 [Cyclobacteriaceae bacterium]|nr:hypothetical protein [Cyclobacteriaceae bacterium]MCH8515856.1 hypothetical protein [Cyclobacteriaceae bacterium]
MNTIELNSEKLYIGLGSNIDYSRWESFSINARIDELNKPQGLVYFEVDSLKMAADLTQKFIKEYRLGSSNWTGGIVLNSSLEFVANVSYNGRVWDSVDWRIAKEIELC